MWTVFMWVELHQAHPIGWSPWGSDYTSELAWECCGIPQEDLDSVAWDREVWTDFLNILLLEKLEGKMNE